MELRGNFFVRFGIIAVLTIAIALSFWQVGARVLVPPVPKDYFPETGHTLKAPFDGYYQEKNGAVLFGYPLTEQITLTETRKVVQYFERARMEYSLDDPAREITLGNLAEEMGYGTPPLQGKPDTPFQRFFPVTGHSSSYGFLAYFNSNGGEEIFGYPITEPFLDDSGRLIQYFQRARMEWWPERPENDRAILANIGTSYVARLPHELTDRLQGNSGDPQPLDGHVIHVTASVADPVARRVGKQTVYVLVTDEAGNPVEGASVSIVVHFNMSVKRLEPVNTSAHGIASFDFNLDPNQPSGEAVIVDVVVTYGASSTSTQTSYLTW